MLATFSCEDWHFAFFLSKIEKEKQKQFRKKKGKLPILAALSRPYECSFKNKTKMGVEGPTIF